MAPTDDAQAAPDLVAAPVAPSVPAAEEGAPDLRAEHDALARTLEARASILEVRRASIALFVGLLGVALTGKLGWDRWGIQSPGHAPVPQHGPALHVWISMAVAVALLAWSIAGFVRARRLLALEDASFARFRELRRALGYDA
jgi:uncharacterized membrane protein YbhN (UPF0104 family)